MMSVMADAPAAESDSAWRPERRAFDEIVVRYQDRVRTFFALRLRDRSQADDLAQETFITAYRRLASFDPDRAFWPWLQGIAANLLRNHHRKSAVPTLDDLEERFDALAAEAADRLGDADVAGALRACLELLPGDAAGLIRARYGEGLSMAELAARDGRSEGALAVALVRIREGLRQCIERRIAREGQP
jgi:RNA polymerase sigma-70 factor (ECF subfamily)